MASPNPKMPSSSSSSLQWLSLTATIWLQTMNGANTNFSLYSSQLKNLLSISQLQLNYLSFASDAGKVFSFLAGFAASFLPLRLILFIGAIFSLIGYGLQFLFLTQKITQLSYWQVFLLTALSGNGICWTNTVCYLICIKNFSSHHRIAVGISTSYVGLSAKVYSDMADAIFHPHEEKRAKAYLLLNAICPVCVAVVTAPVVREDLNRRGGGGKDLAFLVMFVITIATGIFSVVGSIGVVSNWFGPRKSLIFLALLLILPALIIPVCVRCKERSWDEVRRVHEESVKEGGEGEEVVELKGDLMEEVGFKEMMRKMEFWLFFFSYMFGPTVGIVFLNNLGQIAESRGLSNATSIVSMASSFGYFGRLMPSLLDYHFWK